MSYESGGMFSTSILALADLSLTPFFALQSSQHGQGNPPAKRRQTDLPCHAAKRLAER